jgi:adenosylcobinamide-GDP ribazoletransferase
MREAWAALRLAGAFLTVLPVARGVAATPERLARSMGFFPAAGLLLGLLLAALQRALLPLLPAAPVDALLVLALVVLTGGLHLDGLADTVDGLSGGRDREAALRIMKDSRIGALGAAALALALLLKYLGLHHLPPAIKAPALLLMPAAGRWAQVALAGCCRYVRPEGGTGAAFVEQVGWRQMLLAGVTLAAAALALFRWQGGALLLLLALAAAVLKGYYDRRLGGVTGDLLGAATEVVEIFTLLALLALFRLP